MIKINSTYKQFFKFILVGILNTLFGYSIWALLLFFGLHYAIATILSTILGILFNFKTTGTLVFKNHNNKLFLRFISVYVFTSAIGISLLKIANSYNLNLYLIGFLLTGIMAIITFFLQKFYVYREVLNEKD